MFEIVSLLCIVATSYLRIIIIILNFLLLFYDSQRRERRAAERASLAAYSAMRNVVDSVVDNDSDINDEINEREKRDNVERGELFVDLLTRNVAEALELNLVKIFVLLFFATTRSNLYSKSSLY